MTHAEIVAAGVTPALLQAEWELDSGISLGLRIGVQRATLMALAARWGIIEHRVGRRRAPRLSVAQTMRIVNQGIAHFGSWRAFAAVTRIHVRGALERWAQEGMSRAVYERLCDEWPEVFR